MRHHQTCLDLLRTHPLMTYPDGLGILTANPITLINDPASEFTLDVHSLTYPTTTLANTAQKREGIDAFSHL